MGPPSGVTTDDCGGGECYFAQAAPDTLRIGDPTVVDPTTGKPVDLTAERLLELTAAGPLTLRFTPSYDVTRSNDECAVLARGTLNSFGCAMATSQPMMMTGCASSVTIDITISRLWGRTGPAASAKSGDMAVVRDRGTIDAIAVDASNPGQIVHYFGSGSGFESENVYADASRVSLSMLPAVISRTTSNVDAFWSGSTGGLYTAYQAAPDYVWNEENILAPDVPVQFGTTHRVLWSNVPHDAIVTPVARAPGNMDVFYVARDGNVHDASWDSSSGLNAQGQPNWTDAAVTSSGSCMNATAPCAGSASPGGGVAAVARTPDTLDVFYVGTDGGLWNSSLANGAWTTQALYGPSTSAHTQAIAPAGAMITAAARSAHAMDVFLVANHGEIWHSMWADAAPVTAPGSFSTSEVDGTAGTGQPGGPVSAVSPQPAAVDVVYGGTRNGLMWTFIDATTGTTQTMPVANAAGISSSTLGRGAVSLVAPTSYTLQAFYVNSAHQIETITWNGPPCDLANCTVTPSNSQWTTATVLQPPPPPTACSGSSCGPLYLDQNDTPFEVEQGGIAASNLILAGPWVQADHGANATASVVSNPMPDSTITFYYSGASPGSTATVEMMVSTTMATPPGSYIVRVQVTDSGTTETADIPVEVLACTPSPASEACGDPTACGAWSAGCGQTVDCGSCASGDTCMSGHCCPDGWTWSADMQRCESNAPPPTCPPTTPLCPVTNTCLPAATCTKAGGSGGGGCKGTRCI